MDAHLTNLINNSISLLKKGEKLALALNPNDGYTVAFSGGKDSQVLLDLVKRAGVKFVAVYNVTGIDPPENIYFMRKYYPEVKFYHPPKKFFKLIEEHGLPTVKRRYCCRILKEEIGAGNVVLIGVRAEESRKRAQYPELTIHSRRKEHADKTKTHTIEEIEENNHQCIKGKDKITLHPLLHWTLSDIWDYIHEFNLPVNPCYELFERVGCMFCPFSNKKHMGFYEERHPKFKEQLLKSLETYCTRNSIETDLTPVQYYEWWKTKKSMSTYLKSLKQTEINFE